MKKTMKRTIVTSIFILSMFGVGGASAGRLQAQQPINPESLVAIGAHDAWGTVSKVANRPGQVEISVFGLQANAVYTIEVGGTAAANLQTDDYGDGSVRLLRPTVVRFDDQSLRKGFKFEILDLNGSPVLEGRQTAISDRRPGTANAHEERAVLFDVTGGAARAVAKVERKVDGSQELRSTAVGLDVGMSYQVFVDGIPAAIVTTNSAGSGGFELEAPDDSNPLPENLQPVESLRLVEWIRADGARVLSGSFAGVNQGGDDDNGNGDDDGSWYGLVQAIAADGFEMSVGNVIYTVTVDANTVWEDLSGLDALFINDFLEVEGTLQDGVIEASRVELKSGDDGDDGDDDDDDDDDDSDDDDGDDDDGDDDDD